MAVSALSQGQVSRNSVGVLLAFLSRGKAVWLMPFKVFHLLAAYLYIFYFHLSFLIKVDLLTTQKGEEPSLFMGSTLLIWALFEIFAVMNAHWYQIKLRH